MKYVPFIWSDDTPKQKDSIYKYKSKWPIYSLSLKDPTGMWLSLENKIEWCAEKNILKDMDEKDIDLFFDENSNIEFELILFEKVLPEMFFFKILDKMYCYATNDFKEDDEYVDVRFYFDIEELLTTDLSGQLG
jgi:hypothetical protein